MWNFAWSVPRAQKVPSHERSMTKPVKVASLTCSVWKPVKVASLARSVPKACVGEGSRRVTNFAVDPIRASCEWWLNDDYEMMKCLSKFWVLDFYETFICYKKASNSNYNIGKNLKKKLFWA